MGQAIKAALLLSRGGAAFEELVAKRAIGAEPLAGRSGEDAGAAAGRTGLLGLTFGAGDRQLHQGRRAGRFRDRRGIALGGLDDGWRWRLQGWCYCGGGLSRVALPEQPGQPAEHSRLR